MREKKKTLIKPLFSGYKSKIMITVQKKDDF